MQKKVLAVLSLSLVLLGLCNMVRVGSARPPPRPPKPKVPKPPPMNNTFVGSGKVTLQLGDGNRTGTFMISRFQNSSEDSKGIETETFPDPAQTNTDTALLRYDINTTFYIRGDVTSPHCLIEGRNFTVMPPFWEWLYNSATSYEGVRNHTNGKVDESYDFWGYSIGGILLEFGSPRSNKSTDVLYYFNRKGVTSSVYYEFTKYGNGTVPKPTVFDIPEPCKRKFEL